MKLFDKFKLRFPKADFSKFSEEDFMGRPTIMFHGSDGGMTGAMDDHIVVSSIYFSNEMKKALGISPGFPLALTLNPTQKISTPSMYHDVPPQASDLGDKLTNQTVFVTPKDHFQIKFRDVFDSDYLKLTHHHSEEAHRWLRAPDMRY